MNWRTECNKKSNTHCLRFLFDIGDSLHLGFPCLFLPPLTFHRVFSFNKSNLPLHNWTFNYIKIFLIPNESNFFFFSYLITSNVDCFSPLSPPVGPLTLTVIVLRDCTGFAFCLVSFTRQRTPGEW